MVPSSPMGITFARLSRAMTSVKTILMTAVADGKSIGFCFCNSLGESRTVAGSKGFGICLCAKGRRSNRQCLLQSELTHHTSICKAELAAMNIYLSGRNT